MDVFGPRREHSEKPKQGSSRFNGGYFFLPSVTLELPFKSRRSRAGECALHRSRRATGLRVCRHAGFWACMDTQHDTDQLEELWVSGRGPWVHANNAQPFVRSAT